MGECLNNFAIFSVTLLLKVHILSYFLMDYVRFNCHECFSKFKFWKEISSVGDAAMPFNLW